MATPQLPDPSRWWREDSPDAVRAQAEAHFVAAGELENAGRYDEAWREFEAGNRIKHGPLNSAEWVSIYEGAVARLAELMTPALIAERGVRGGERAPIFIVGMPRSGSTLIEQILATHPAVQGMGESMAMPQVLADAWPFDPMGPLEPARMAGAYLGRVRAEGWRRTPRFTDKLLANYAALGHVQMMFPRAVVLHAVRDAADTCLSCYRALFLHDGHVRFAYDLADIGRYYVAYRAMMDHWRRTLPAGRIVEVSNEALAADPEGQMRRLLAACGLDWDPKVTRFHENEREVHTASARQVRLPIFETSIGRWRLYRKHLDPLFEALGPYAPADA